MSEADYGAQPQTFAEMGLHEEVLRAVTDMGFREPMPVQRRTYRPVMAGRDLIVQSRTGSGKTAAFGIPFVQGLVDPAADCRNGHIQALVLGPTRELALQVGAEISRLAIHRPVTVTAVYGGAPMGKQIEALKAGSHIVAGTPGRVLDHLRRGTLNLSSLRVIVLDEADEMLSMGFLEDIIEVLRRCPPERQTLLFSATMPDEVVRLAGRYQKTPLMLQLSADQVGTSDISHAYYMVSGMGRSRDLLRILQIERPDSAMIFCNTREETSTVAEFLRSQGLDAEPISSDLTQAERERVMGRMKAKNLHYLVATDVAARGIDISDLSHVLNYTFPESAEVYVHRTGRTGRAGKAGIAISLISPRELGNFYYLKLTYKIRPEERTLPTEAELQTLREGQYLDRLVREFAHRKPAAEFRSLLKRVMASEDSERLMALLLEHYLGRPSAAGEASHAPAHVHVHGPGHRERESHQAPNERDRRPPRHREDESGAEPQRAREPHRETSRDREPPRDEQDGRRRGPRRDREDEGDSRGRSRSRSDDTRRREAPREAAPPPPPAPVAAAPAAAAPVAPAAPAEVVEAAAPAAPVAAAAAAPPSEGRSSASERPRPPRRPPSRPAATPGGAAPSPDDIIHVEDGRDFWEAWVDARKATPGAAAPASGGAESEADSADADGDRRRRRRRDRSEYVPAPGEVRLYLNLGRRDQVTDESLVEFLGQRSVTRFPMELHSTHAYLYVPDAQADGVIAALSGSMYGQRAVLCERARR